MQGREEPRLERSIGLTRVVFQSVATMAPAASVVFGLGFVILFAGPATPFSMLVGACGALLIAFCLKELARHISSAGGIYSFTATALGDYVGFLVGWAYSVLYVLLICLVAISFSLVGTDFLDFYLGLSVPEWVLSVILVGFTTTMTFLGIRPSTALTATLATLEVGLLLIIALLLIVRAGGDNTLALFDPRNAAGVEGGTLRAVFLGIVFAFSLVSGFEGSLPLAEEAKDPRRMVPRAVLLASGGIGLFYVIASYAAVLGWGQGQLGTFIESPNPWREMANDIGGFFGFLVVLAILNSQIAAMQALFNATSRVLYAMSRNRLLPAAVSRIHPRTNTPYIAAALTAVIALGGTFLAKAWFNGAFPAYTFFLTTLTIIFISIYAIVCVAAAAFYLRRMRSEFDPLSHLLVPALALGILAPTLYYSVRGLSDPANLAIPAVLVWTGIGAVVLAFLVNRGVDISAEGQRWLLQENRDEPSVQP